MERGENDKKGEKWYGGGGGGRQGRLERRNKDKSNGYINRV